MLADVEDQRRSFARQLEAKWGYAYGGVAPKECRTVKYAEWEALPSKRAVSLV